ncbi:hypothetical protein ACOMHN_021697 [Nucella lapillus]
MQLDSSNKPTTSHKRDPLAGDDGNGGAAAAAGVFYLSRDARKRLTWEHLETVRLKRLRIPNRYSRHLGKDFTMPQEMHPSTGPTWKVQLKPTPITSVKEKKEEGKVVSTNNSLAPFYTLAKPTCGYFFSRQTDNKKRNFGIPASDMVKWRSFTQ